MSQSKLHHSFPYLRRITISWKRHDSLCCHSSIWADTTNRNKSVWRESFHLTKYWQSVQRPAWTLSLGATPSSIGRGDCNCYSRINDVKSSNGQWGRAIFSSFNLTANFKHASYCLILILSCCNIRFLTGTLKRKFFTWLELQPEDSKGAFDKPQW